jgi:hypothetical protein
MIIGAYGFILKFILSERKGVSRMDFEEHKKSVQYKDVCSEIVKRIEQKADDRHSEVKEDLAEIKQLIRNGHS